MTIDNKWVRAAAPAISQEMAQAAGLTQQLIEEARVNGLALAEYGLTVTGLNITIDADGAADVHAWQDAVTQIAGAPPSNESWDRHEDSSETHSVSRSFHWDDCQGPAVYLYGYWTEEHALTADGS
jgi:hypothetical protein